MSNGRNAVKYYYFSTNNTDLSPAAVNDFNGRAHRLECFRIAEKTCSTKQFIIY